MTPASPPPGTIVEPRIWALVPCAGSGSRAGGDLPKQYQMVAGLPMVVHSLKALGQVPEIAGTVVVISPLDSYFESYIDQYLTKNSSIKIANCGGNSRHESVSNGLVRLIENKSKENDWVLVHDAARCLVTPGQIQALIDACLADEVGGLLALKVPDTLKTEREGRVNGTVDRADKWLAQTPQMFRIGMLKKALQQAAAPVTDESSAIEQLGLKPKLVEGSAQNFKVTYPADFALAESILLARQAQKAAVDLPFRSHSQASQQ